jgi:hypothetical protein
LQHRVDLSGSACEWFGDGVERRQVQRRPPRDGAKFDATEQTCGWSYRLVGTVDAIEAEEVSESGCGGVCHRPGAAPS